MLNLKDFAGGLNFEQTGCQGNCYENYTMGDPSHYSEAYFDIASIRIFSIEGAPPVEPSAQPNDGPGEQGNGVASEIPSFLAFSVAILFTILNCV